MTLRLFGGASCMLVLVAVIAAAAPPDKVEDWPPKIARKLPPPAKTVSDTEILKLTDAHREVRETVKKLPEGPIRIDIEIFDKALAYALIHNEIFDSKADMARVELLRKTAVERGLVADVAPWNQQRGTVVRGYRSKLDDSVQPYAVVIPKELDLSKPVPLYVWLHGRGDTKCDLQFIAGFLGDKTPGPLLPADAIVLHPFGRYCNGWKSAGEVDVFEAIENVKKHYPIDDDRIVLAGFSMGGAGAWHLGAHYADRWCAVHTGAGFVDVRRYQKLADDALPPWYEQKLWGLYDVPDYRRNLLNVPVLAYSGENDTQKAAADIMTAELATEGYKIPHLIGPGMGHKYAPDVLADIQQRLATIVEKGRDPLPKKVSLQTRTLRYNKMFWIEPLGLLKHWEDSRIDAEVTGPKSIAVTTKNIHAFKVSSPWGVVKTVVHVEIVVDGEKLIATTIPPLRTSTGLAVISSPQPTEAENIGYHYLVKRSNGWKMSTEPPYDYLPQRMRPGKIPGLQGPIDDAFIEPFSVDRPKYDSNSQSQVNRWVEFESQHFFDRWSMLMRGEAKTFATSGVLPSDRNQVLWGTPSTNSQIARILSRLPLKWTEKVVGMGDLEFDATKVVPMLIYPNPENPTKYVVINSGLTFREGHDRTNSLQNPKLGDWAFVDITEPPTDLTPGKVLAAGFFDEQWRYVPAQK